MFIKNLLIPLAFSLFSIPAIATATNCNENKSKNAYIQSISVGVDNGSDANISVILVVDGVKSDSIPIYRKLNDEHGKGIFELLLASYKKESPIIIVRCVNNQIAGITSQIIF